MTKKRRCSAGLPRKMRDLDPEELAAVEAFVESGGRQEGTAHRSSRALGI